MRRVRGAGWLVGIAASAFATATLAQQPDQTGTGSGPLSTIYAPHTTATGVTKPPSRAAAPDVDMDRRTPDMKAMDRIDDGICTGCGVTNDPKK